MQDTENFIYLFIYYLVFFSPPCTKQHQACHYHQQGSLICQHSPLMKTVRQIRSAREFRREPNRVFAKEHFYMFSRDSTSLTENSWSVPK